MWLKIILCVIGFTCGESGIVKRACQDAIPNCSDYTTGICGDPLYTQWVKDKCAKFCNKCTAAPTIQTAPPLPVITTVATGCVDKLANCKDYGRAVCTDDNYKQWVTENCGLFCQKCTSGTMGPPTPASNTCKDTIPNCVGYTKSVCSDHQYDDWVLNNCALFCQRCGPSAITTTPKPATVAPLATCHDALTNCQDYGTDVCIDPLYSKWVQENCAHSCRKCDSNGPSNTNCQDNVGNCAELQQSRNICTDPNSKVYADQNCRATCGSCTGGSNLPDSFLPLGLRVTTPASCVDALTNCADYGASVCKDTNYYQWAKQNCPKTCNMCPGAITTPPSGTDSIGCVYAGQVYQEGENWKDACKYRCTCQDGVTGKYVCTEMCFTWKLPDACHMNPPAAGRCCATPSCPAGYTINYPPGRWDF